MAGIGPFLVALAVVAVSAPNPNDFEISHSCILLVDGNWRMDLTIEGNGNQVDRILAVNSTDPPLTTFCDNSPVGGANAVQEFTEPYGNDTYFFRADIDSSSGVVTPDCGQITSPDDGLAPAQYRWLVKVESDDFHPDIQLAFEKTYIITCDFNDPTSIRNETIGVNILVKNAPPPEVVDLKKDGGLDVVLASSFSPVNTINLGTLTRIKAFLLTENVVPVDPPRTGVSPYNCRACRTMSCNAFIQLTDNDGCIVANTMSGPFTNTVGDAGANGSVLYSGSFEFFSFSQSLNTMNTNVSFACTFDYCDSNTGPELCADRCGFFTRRKKREVSNARNNRESGGTVTKNDVTVTVKVVRDTIMTERNPVTGKFLKSAVDTDMVNSHRTRTPTERDDHLCNGYTGFIAGVCILGVSFVVAVAACVFFCVKISRARSEKADSLGISNPAFHQ